MENNSKPLFSLTVEEFKQALHDIWATEVVQNNNEESSSKFLYGLKELANFLGCSLSTAARIHKSGVLQAATFKIGRILMFDQEMVLELLRVTKRRFSGPRGGYRCS